MSTNWHYLNNLKPGKTGFKRNQFSRTHMLVFVLVFGLLGILAWRTFAANPNLPGDINNDNVVNVTDLSILLTNYGTTNTTADLNADGAVNITDLSILLSHYGGSYVPPPPSGGVPKHTYDVTVIPTATGGQEALWMGWYDYRQREFDRTVNDEFYGSMLWQPSTTWPVGPNAGETWLNYSGPSDGWFGGDPRAYQGKWGRVWNFHNADKEIGGAGWDYNPGWSANAMDFINGNLVWNLEDNPVNNYMLVPWSQMQLGHRYTISMHCIMGRKDGEGGTRQGVLEVWVDGVKKLDLHNVNTIWKFTQPQTVIQRYYWMWAGFYTSDMHAGYNVNFKAAYPFTGPTIAAMKAEMAGGEGEDGIGGGFSHYSAGSSATLLSPSWSSSDLILPQGW